METGAITDYIDVAQVALYIFWGFFAALVLWLHQEGKREGYPLVSDRSDHILVQGFPAMPKPKTFLLPNGHVYKAPPGNVDERPVAAAPRELFPGAPLWPTGNPLVDGVGPAAWAMREDVPERTAEGELRTVPLRVATDFSVAEEDADPRGMTVFGADRVPVGIVRDLWIDRSEPMLRYLETEIETAAGKRNVLVPLNFSRIHQSKGVVTVKALMAAQFADVPAPANPDALTAREEDMITGYFGGGTLYAHPDRAEPLI